MKLLLLPGNSKRNKEWIERVAEACAPFFDEVVCAAWSHWTTDREMIDIESEAARIGRLVSGWSSYAVFAKSAGILVALRAMRDGVLKPEKCIFVGLPVDWATEKKMGLVDLLGTLKIQALFIQHTADPACRAKGVRDLLDELGIAGQVIDLPGDTHEYTEITTLRDLTRDFTSSFQPTRELVINELRQVIDPEINMDIWTLGLIYDVKVEGGVIKIKMTFTTPLCPYGPALLDEIRTRLRSLEDVKDVVIDVVFEPLWVPPEDVRLEFGL